MAVKPSILNQFKEAGYHRTFDLSPRWARARKPLKQIQNFIEEPYMFWTSTGQNPYILHGTICFSFHFLREQVKINLLTNFERNFMVKTFWKIATSAFFVVIWAQFSVDFMNKMMNFELNFDFFSNSLCYLLKIMLQLYVLKKSHPNLLSFLRNEFFRTRLDFRHFLSKIRQVGCIQNLISQKRARDTPFFFAYLKSVLNLG